MYKHTQLPNISHKKIMARFSPSADNHCISQEHTSDHYMQQPYIANNRVGERDYLAVVVAVEQRETRTAASSLPTEAPRIHRCQCRTKIPRFRNAAQEVRKEQKHARLLATTTAHLEGIAPRPSPGWPPQPERTGTGWTGLPTDRSWRRRVTPCNQTWFLLYLKSQTQTF
jgi:hypothetical protein